MNLIASIKSLTHELTGYFIYLLFTGTLGPLLYGYHLAELNAPQDVITCARKPISIAAALGLPQCIPMTAAQIGLVSSIFTLGGLLGALIAGPFSARYGRLRAMRTTTAAFALGPIGEALAPSIPIMCVGRFVSGMGAGAALVVVPIYISEIAPPKEKGFFGAFTQIMVNVGIFVAQLLGYFLSYGSMWRLILAIGGLLGLSQLLGLTLAVDSPKWLADHGETQQAKSALRKIRGDGADITAEMNGWSANGKGGTDEEHQTLLSSEDHSPYRHNVNPSAEDTKPEALGIFQVLRHPKYARATFAVMVVMLAQQWTGINSIIMYGVSLLSDLLKANSALLNIFVSILNIVVTTACAPLVDIWGRKPCLLASIAGMGTSSVLLGIGIRAGMSTLSAVAVLLFVSSFALGLGPVPFILSSELVGPEAVGATQSWALAANWIATFVVAQFFPIVNQALGKGFVYFIFAGLGVGFFTFVSFFVPETMGMKDADEVWGRTGRRED